MSVDAFLDTNILLYAQSKDPAEAGKKTTAREILALPRVALSAQVLGEFYVNATGKIKPPLTHGEAERILRGLDFLPIQAITPALVFQALEIEARHGISYWDSLIIAAAKELGCRRIFSEDLSDAQSYVGVEVVNPFRSL